MVEKANKKIDLVLISGVSGAGKTTLAHLCEELGFYVLEDLPSQIIPPLLTLIKSDPEKYSRTAIIVSLETVEEIGPLILKDPDISLQTLGLDCSIDSLMNRFRLTRHLHPLQAKGYSLENALKHDEELMKKIRPYFDVYIDTTGLNEKALRKIARPLLAKANSKTITIVFSSFGYKYGLPRDAEVVIDARVLANPYWVPSLAPLTGLDQPVIEYIDKDKKTKPFLDSLYLLLDQYIESAIEESRIVAFIDVGCSGGQHRSVYIAEHLFAHYKDKYNCIVAHRELSRYREDEKD
jgi:UPF0042 nucleotide-binding protein